jgi:hypothetical protein
MVSYHRRGEFDNAEVNLLHAQGFDHAVLEDDWRGQVERHSLGWVCARAADGSLVGFVNVPWDGAIHAFLLDTRVSAHRRRADRASAVSDGHHHHGDHHSHQHDGGHGHSHGLVDRSIVRSREGVRAVAASLAVLGATAAAQAAIFLLSGSVALLAGLAVVGAILVSACVALYETIERPLHPQTPTHLWVLAGAGLIGFAGNELAAGMRLRAGRRLNSPPWSQTAGTHGSTGWYRWASLPVPPWWRPAPASPIR